jgi:hypothetical protein
LDVGDWPDIIEGNEHLGSYTVKGKEAGEGALSDDECASGDARSDGLYILKTHGGEAEKGGGFDPENEISKAYRYEASCKCGFGLLRGEITFGTDEDRYRFDIRMSG